MRALGTTHSLARLRAFGLRVKTGADSHRFVFSVCFLFSFSSVGTTTSPTSTRSTSSTPCSASSRRTVWTRSWPLRDRPTRSTSSATRTRRQRRPRPRRSSKTGTIGPPAATCAPNHTWRMYREKEREREKGSHTLEERLREQHATGQSKAAGGCRPVADWAAQRVCSGCTYLDAHNVRNIHTQTFHFQHIISSRVQSEKRS
jgi:hypothetical protein